MNFLNQLLSPKPLPYDYEDWKKEPFTQRAKMVCQAWAIQGFGAPISIAVFYFLKIVFYVWMWIWFCSFSIELGTRATIATWWFELEALGKFIFWTALLEVSGLGGASGPLTGRYVPPLGGMTYFLRPNTIKVPLFPNTPIIGNDKRSILDVALNLLLFYCLIQVCIAPKITPEIVLPVVLLLPLCGVLDRTVFLAARADIYFPMIVCFMFPEQTGHGLKLIWFGIWFWAAFSKLTPNFTSAVCVMICNSPCFGLSIFQKLKKRLFQSYPDNLQPSKLANYMAHFGTAIEFISPIILILFIGNAEITYYALIALTVFHVFIFINFPMGVPMEWNVIMVLGAWSLFLYHPEFTPLALHQPGLIAVLAMSLFVLPLMGNFFPRKISFLLSMRYYAGTWAYSVWLFKGDSKEKIDQNIPKTSKDLIKQLLLFYDKDTAEATMSRVTAFRLMHLPGRLLHSLLPKAVENIDDYQWVEGEFIAGEVVGWNFGDGHLHHEPVLAAIQKRCNFESGELRVIMVESPTFLSQKLEYRIHDAKDGLIEDGLGYTKDFIDKMPWGEDF